MPFTGFAVQPAKREAVSRRDIDIMMNLLVDIIELLHSQLKAYFILTLPHGM